MQDYIPREKDINQIIEPIIVKQFDNNSRFLHVQFTDVDLAEGENAFDLENCSVSLYIEPEGNTDPSAIAYIDGTVESAENGVMTFLIPGSVTQNVGRYKCEIHINEGDTTTYPAISSKPFFMTVEETIRDDQAIMASAQFSALDRWASDVQNIKSRMTVIETMAESGEIPTGVEAEVVAARTDWRGVAHTNLRESVLDTALSGLVYLGTFLNSSTWSEYKTVHDGEEKPSFDALPNNIFAVCNVTETTNPIQSSPVSGSMVGTILTFGRNDKDYRRDFDTQIFIPHALDKIFIRKYRSSAWGSWNAVGGTYLESQMSTLPQFRAGVNDEYVSYNYLVSNVTDDGTFFVSQTATVNGETVRRWTDLPTADQNFIIKNSRYSANSILQTAIPTDTLNPVYSRIIARPGITYTVKPWSTYSGIDTRKKILAVGDSICRGWRNGGKGFVGDLGLPYENEGVSGATLSTDRADVTNIPTQLANYKSNHPNYRPDIIIANGGHNDYDRNVLLGDIPTRPAASVSALNMSTVMGGLQKLFLTMIQEYPTAERFFVTTHKIKKNGVYLVTENNTAGNNTAGYNEADLHDAIVACCNVYNVKIIDVFNDSPINSFFPEYVSNINYTYNPTPTDSTGWAEAVANTTDYINADGVHPLSRGYLEGYKPLILAALKGNTSGGVSKPVGTMADFKSYVMGE